MDFTTSVKTVYFEKYATFSGRASRSEFWWSVLFGFIVNAVTGALGSGSEMMDLLGVVVSALMLIPSIAVAVRRFHDIDKSGLWILINFIPLIGWIWYLVLMATAGEPTANRYGPIPSA